MGCPNAFPHTNALKQRVWAGENDCNTLNIYRCTTKATNMPVLVYIHEGGWWSRSNSNIHPASAIRNVACRGQEHGTAGMVIVSLNYRLGPYGHFNPHQRTAGSAATEAAPNTNFALQDIRVGLEWIQQNAGHFGGDRTRVTVMARGRGAQLASLLSRQMEAEGEFGPN